jgi:hypothetical protein
LSFFASSRPSLNLLYHSETLDFFIVSAPYASVNICRVSLVLLLNFAQNLMLMHCSNNTCLCNTATASLLLPYLLHQCNHRHIITCRYSMWHICRHSGNLIVRLHI